jgi:chromosome segregation ATPase
LAVGPDVPPAIGRLCAPFAPSAVLRERFAVLGRVHGLDFALRETTRHEQRLRREAAERDTVVEDLRGSLDEVLRHRDSVLAAQAMAEKRLLTQESTITTQRQALREAEATLDDAREQAGVQEAAARHQAGLLEAAMREQSGLLEAAADNHAGLLEAAARDHAGLLKAAALDRAGLLQEREQQIDKRDQTISGFAARAAEDKGELSRLRTEIEGLWGSLAAARADTKGAREDGRAEAARLQAGIDQRDRELPALRTRQLEPSLSRPGFSLRPRRH